MKPLLSGLAAGLLLIAFYFLAWPVPISPVAWSPPADAGLTGAYSPNDILSFARARELGGHHGPEDVANGRNGDLYATVRDGVVLRLPARGGDAQVYAQTGGRPLGIELLADGSLLVANAELGLQQVLPGGKVITLLDTVDGKLLGYANDVAVAPDGRIYLTEASTRFAAAQYRGTLEASLLDILEHGGSGMLIEYDPETRASRVLLRDLNFPNGVAISTNGDYLLLAETGSYRILKYGLQGPGAGSSEVLLDNLPGFPDNINNGLNGRFWIGLVAPRNDLLDRNAGRPFVRKLIQRLPSFLRPKPAPSSHVIAIDGDGVVLMNLQDPAARFPQLTGVLERQDRLYLTTLAGPWLPYIDKADLL